MVNEMQKVNFCESKKRVRTMASIETQNKIAKHEKESLNNSRDETSRQVPSILTQRLVRSQSSQVLLTRSENGNTTSSSMTESHANTNSSEESFDLMRTSELDRLKKIADNRISEVTARLLGLRRGLQFPEPKVPVKMESRSVNNLCAYAKKDSQSQAEETKPKWCPKAFGVPNSYEKFPTLSAEPREQKKLKMIEPHSLDALMVSISQSPHCPIGESSQQHLLTCNLNNAAQLAEHDRHQNFVKVFSRRRSSAKEVSDPRYAGLLPADALQVLCYGTAAVEAMSRTRDFYRV